MEVEYEELVPGNVEEEEVWILEKIVVGFPVPSNCYTSGPGKTMVNSEITKYLL